MPWPFAALASWHFYFNDCQLGRLFVPKEIYRECGTLMAEAFAQEIIAQLRKGMGPEVIEHMNVRFQRSDPNAQVTGPEERTHRGFILQVRQQAYGEEYYVQGTLQWRVGLFDHEGHIIV